MVIVKEARKSPQQKVEENERFAKRRAELRMQTVANREAWRKEQKEIEENAPAKGCLQSMLEIGFLGLLAGLSILLFIICLSSS